MLVHFIYSIFFLILISNLCGRTEKMFIKQPSQKILKIVDSNSLKLFKNTRIFLFSVGAVESIWRSQFNSLFFALGCFLLIIGVLFRCLAIYSLAELWSYHIILYEKHHIVRRGIYRIIRHPAYIGNIYIVGLLICINSYITSIIAFIFVVLFYLYRSNLEDKLLKSMELSNEDMEIVPWYIK